MPLYDFETSKGEHVEVFFHMADAPSLGSKIRHKGRVLRRVLSPSSGVVKNYEHVAHSLRQWVPTRPDEPCPYPNVVRIGNGKGYGRFKPAFKSKRDTDEFRAKSGGKYAYDPD